ncbi:hypothetical protein M153_1100025468 [Pseudoloma neurophilia]|uniref:Uncharacterized protein n=1 Tax=Pseudoloma neurophilia TaxID=146866 RepID=A0A0R0M192_9MICR|nr:hypothetical protein M153_1100025468 [Pseudoloma neurophilia]
MMGKFSRVAILLLLIQEIISEKNFFISIEFEFKDILNDLKKLSEETTTVENFNDLTSEAFLRGYYRTLKQNGTENERNDMIECLEALYSFCVLSGAEYLCFEVKDSKINYIGIIPDNLFYWFSQGIYKSDKLRDVEKKLLNIMRNVEERFPENLRENLGLKN